jgi:hypothetical protein
MNWIALYVFPEGMAFPNFCYLAWESFFSLLVAFHNLGVTSVREESYSCITPELSLPFPISF